MHVWLRAGLVLVSVTLPAWPLAFPVSDEAEDRGVVALTVGLDTNCPYGVVV